MIEQQEHLSYIVPCDRLDHVRSHLDKIIRRAAKKGLSTLTYKIGTEPHFVPQVIPFHDPFDPDCQSKTVQLECREVTLSAPVLKLAGWFFVGRIEHLKTDDGDVVNIVYNAPGTEVPSKYRERSQTCDHCQHKRYRRDTFIVQHENGETKQVGSTCLSDFLGVDASRFMAWASLIQSFTIKDSDEDWFEASGPRQSRVFGLRWILRVAAATYLDRGYVSRAKSDAGFGMATADLIRSYITATKQKVRDALIPQPEDNPPGARQHWIDKGTKLTDDTEQWVKDLCERDYDELGDYLSNLAVLGRVGYCPWKAIGILGSAVMAYCREQERNVKNAENLKSEHQGEVKKKVFVENATVIFVRPFEGYYGNGIIYKFRDPDGNLYTWFATTKANDMEVDAVVSFMATVKKHDTDKYLGDAKVTVVNRLNTDPKAIERAKKRAKV